MQLINLQLHAFHSAEHRVDAVNELLVDRRGKLTAGRKTGDNILLLPAKQLALVFQHRIIQRREKLLCPGIQQIIQAIFNKLQSASNRLAGIIRRIEVAVRTVRSTLKLRRRAFIANLDRG